MSESVDTLTRADGRFPSLDARPRPGLLDAGPRPQQPRPRAALPPGNGQAPLARRYEPPDGGAFPRLPGGLDAHVFDCFPVAGRQGRSGGLRPVVVAGIGAGPRLDRAYLQRHPKGRACPAWGGSSARGIVAPATHPSPSAGPLSLRAI